MIIHKLNSTMRMTLNKKNNNIYTRNLLDDLRFSLEVLVKAILKNSKSLENQKAELGNFLKENGISVEIRKLIY